MLFKILKLFGVDLPAVMAEARVDVEERFDLAKDSVEQAAQTGAILALLFFLAGVAALSAFGVGLIALYYWISNNYGEFYGFAAIGSILIFIAIIMFAIAIGKKESWPGERARRIAAKRLEFAQARAERVAAAAEAFEGPALLPSQSSSAGDLIEPLVWALSGTTKLPAMGNLAMDELFTRLQSSARGVADETVDSLVRTVRSGDRPQLVLALGSAMFVGWLLGRQSERKVDVL
jgi:uncharacterized membrane protein